MLKTGLREGAGFRKLIWLGFIVLWLSAAAVIRPLALPDEGRYVGIAWEMASSGDWLVPHLDGLPYFHKPPLFYWMTAASVKVCGPHLLCSRLAPLLAALMMALTLFWFLKRHLDQKTAIVGFIALLTQPFFFAGAEFANLDMLVAGMIAITIMMAAEFVWAREKGHSAKRYLVATYFFVAAGILERVDRDRLAWGSRFVMAGSEQALVDAEVFLLVACHAVFFTGVQPVVFVHGVAV